MSAGSRDAETTAIALEVKARERVHLFVQGIKAVRSLEGGTWAIFIAFALFSAFYLSRLAKLVGLGEEPIDLVRWCVYIICALAAVVHIVVVVIRYYLQGKYVDQQFNDALNRFDEAVARGKRVPSPEDQELVKKCFRVQQPVFFKGAYATPFGITVALAMAVICAYGFAALVG